MSKHDALYIRTSPLCTGNQRVQLEKKLGRSKRPRQWYEDVGCEPMGERPAYAKLLADIKSGGVGRLYVASLRALGFRNLDELGDLIVLCEEQGVEWKGPEPTFRSAARAASAFRSERHDMRVREGIAQRKSQGKSQGGDRKSGTRDIPPESVKKILDLHERGLSDREIARRVGHDRRTVKSVRERGG